MVKRCCYGTYKSDTRYLDREECVIEYFPFPKPLKDLEKCQRWIRLCGRPHQQLNLKILQERSKAKHIYICSKGILSDYCEDWCPMIPGIVIHCVNQIEARGLNEVGIYSLPGSVRQIKELKEKFFKGKGMPNLSNIDDIHVICGCLKDFLRDLNEPLVTFKLWKDFVRAAENRDKAMAESDMYQALSELPRANRDTIAFVMLHLIRVSQTPDCRMPANNLSRVFGHTIVGHSSPEQEPMQLINELKYQAMVMDRLFEIPEDYWINFISDEAGNI